MPWGFNCVVACPMCIYLCHVVGPSVPLHHAPPLVCCRLCTACNAAGANAQRHKPDIQARPNGCFPLPGCLICAGCLRRRLACRPPPWSGPTRALQGAPPAGAGTCTATPTGRWATPSPVLPGDCSSAPPPPPPAPSVSPVYHAFFARTAPQIRCRVRRPPVD